MTTDPYLRYKAWGQKHALPRKCEFCEYIHEGRMDYRNHMVEEHPEQNEKFEAFCGLKPARISVPQGTSKGE